jgi:hypothetical protein
MFVPVPDLHFYLICFGCFLCLWFGCSFCWCWLLSFQYSTLSEDINNIWTHLYNIWHDCNYWIYSKNWNHSDIFFQTLASLDILALVLLVSQLTPNEKVLNKTESRTKWLRQVCDYRPVIERILGQFSQDIENKEFGYGKRCQENVERTR